MIEAEESPDMEALFRIFDRIAPEVLDQQIREMDRELAQRIAANKLAEYSPYAKQKEFHNAGAQYRERLFLAGNRCGKTMAGAFELAIHLTGAYPVWWQGKRFEKPVRAWAAGITGESTRDVVQEKLFGPPDRRDAWGTGAIPKANLGEILMGRGIANAIDLVSIKHSSGDWSSLAFKSYEKGREKWQGAALEVVWMDEEPPSDLYYEGLTRTNETQGLVYITCTPLLGMSDVMRMFLMDN
jgi:phage terminase large subunit-like protein